MDKKYLVFILILLMFFLEYEIFSFSENICHSLYAISYNQTEPKKTEEIPNQQKDKHYKGDLDMSKEDNFSDDMKAEDIKPKDKDLKLPKSSSLKLLKEVLLHNWYFLLIIFIFLILFLITIFKPDIFWLLSESIKGRLSFRTEKERYWENHIKRIDVNSDYKINQLILEFKKTIEPLSTKLDEVLYVLKEISNNFELTLHKVLDERDNTQFMKEMQRKRTEIINEFESNIAEISNMPKIKLSNAIYRLSLKINFDESLYKNFIEIGKRYEELITEWSKFSQASFQYEPSKLLDRNHWQRKIDDIKNRLNSLLVEPPIISFLPLLDAVGFEPSAQKEKLEIMELLNLEEDIPKVNSYLEADDLNNYEIVGSEGAGKHFFIKEVISPGFKKRDTKVSIRKAKIKVFLR